MLFFFVALDLPDLSILTTADQGETKYSFSGCEIAVSQDGCRISFAPDAASCKSGISVKEIIKRFFPSMDLKKVSDNMVLPNIFKIEKFKLDKCTGDIHFTANANEPFDLIGGKIKIAQGKLLLSFNFKASEFDLSSIEVSIRGTVTVGAQTIKLSAEKKRKSNEFTFLSESDKISLADFRELFTKKEIQKEKTPKKIESLVNAAVDKPKISGTRAEDGSYEFVVTGTVRDMSAMDSATIYLIIQKPVDNGIVVAVVCHFKEVSPTQILSLILKKNLSKLPLLGDLAMNFIVEIASETIETVRDKEANKALLTFISGGRSVCKGLKLKIEVPVHEIMRSNNKHMIGKVPEKLHITIYISDERIQFVFPDNFKTNLMNVLIALTPAVSKTLPKSVFKNGPPKVDIKRFNIDVQTGVVDVSATASDPVVIGNNLIEISNVEFDLKHDKKADSPWEFKIAAEQNIGDANLKVSIVKKSRENFIFSGSVKSLTTKGLMKKFGAKLFPAKDLEDIDFFNFGIKHLKVEGNITDDLSLR
eukprot:Seg143.2 transcript_id=Seg143.2/GoldUCD/mRNA.D3Y31 product="hypothetical protein" protein_id=Seg143.2/GoldUCD/D3Y31